MTSLVSINPTSISEHEHPSADRHPALVYLARLSPGSRPTQKRALDTLAEIASGGRHDLFSFPWADLRYSTAQWLRAILAERYAPSTANRHLAALRGVLREAWRLGHLSAEEFHRAVDLRSVGGERQPAGRSLDRGELRALFDACVADRSPAGARDTALLAVLYAGGLRRAEAVGLDHDDYDAATGALLVRHGKGRKERRVYLNGSARAVLGGWLRLRGDEPGPLFHAVKKGGRIDRTKSISGQAVLYILRRVASRAGVKPFSPHDLRRTFIGDLLDAGADIATVQALAGHANVQTTARYDRRPEEARRQAAELLSIPVGCEIWGETTWAA
jgi:integrase